MINSTDSTDELAKLRERLVNAYRKLPPLDKKILQLLSVIYEPVSRTKLLACLNEMKVLDSDKKSLVMQTLKPPCDRLSALNLLVQEKNQGSECHPLVIEIVTRDAVKTGQFEPIVKAIEKALPIDLSLAGRTSLFHQRTPTDPRSQDWHLSQRCGFY